MIVADPGPIIVFARIGRFSLLEQVFETLLIPDAVYHELIVAGQAGADEIAQCAWIQLEVLVSAEGRHAPLLLDDLRARREAEQRGITVVGLLWVLGEAKRRRFMSEARPIIDELLAVDYWLHPERVIRPFLEAMGAPPHRAPRHIPQTISCQCPGNYSSESRYPS